MIAKELVQKKYLGLYCGGESGVYINHGACSRSSCKLFYKRLA